MILHDMLNRLHKFYRHDEFVQNIFKCVSITFNNIIEYTSSLRQQFFFDTLTFSLNAYEKLLGLVPAQSQSIEDRRSAIRAKWLSSSHNSLNLIKKLCECWKNGEVEANFVNGKIQLLFKGEYGVPKDLYSLVTTINEVKPAHIALFYIFKYLLIKDIHIKMTINEMQTYTISQFGNGKSGVKQYA